MICKTSSSGYCRKAKPLLLLPIVVEVVVVGGLGHRGRYDDSIGLCGETRRDVYRHHWRRGLDSAISYLIVLELPFLVFVRKIIVMERIGHDRRRWKL